MKCDPACQDPARLRYLGHGKRHLDTTIALTPTAEEKIIIDKIWADQAKSSYDVDPRDYFGVNPVPVLVPGTLESLWKPTSETVAA